jgi:hypothetical protein
MGLFSKIKKAFKKITGAVKKVVKKVVKGVKKVVKKIGSSKILKALAIAAAAVVTGGAALGAMGATAASGGFTGWMVGASQAVTGGTLFGTSTALARGAGTVAKLAASPFKALGTGIGTVGSKLGVNLAPASSTATPAQLSAAVKTNPAAAARASTAASRGALNLPSTLPGASTAASATGTAAQQLAATAGSLPGATVGSFGTSAGMVGTVSGTAAQQLATTVPAALGTSSIGTAATTAATAATAAPQASWFARHPKLTSAATFVGKTVGGAALTGMTQQYIAGDPEQQGSMAGAAYEGESNLDPLRVYAAQQGINTDSIYQNMMYGNVDPSTQYSSELFRQQTFGVA